MNHGTPTPTPAQPCALRITACADVDALRNVSPEMRAAVLANSNVKIFLKLDGAAG